MTFNIVATLSLVLAAALCSEGAVTNHFKMLGKFTKISPGINDQQTIQETSYYFLSQNAAGWATSASDCRAYLGDTASLLYLETDEEVAWVTELLNKSDDTGSTYWIGGKYDLNSSTFAWDNGVEIESTAPWDQGHPNTRTAVTRVLAYTVGGLKLRTDFQTVSLRYICELVA